jgi:hypothetical protein
MPINLITSGGRKAGEILDDETSESHGAASHGAATRIRR